MFPFPLWPLASKGHIFSEKKTRTIHFSERQNLSQISAISPLKIYSINSPERETQKEKKGLLFLAQEGWLS